MLLAALLCFLPCLGGPSSVGSPLPPLPHVCPSISLCFEWLRLWWTDSVCLAGVLRRRSRGRRGNVAGREKQKEGNVTRWGEKQQEPDFRCGVACTYMSTSLPPFLPIPASPSHPGPGLSVFSARSLSSSSCPRSCHDIYTVWSVVGMLDFRRDDIWKIRGRRCVADGRRRM